MLLPLHGYQKVCINHLIQVKTGCLFIDMGMGKTASVLYAFRWLKAKGLVKKMLIIAPKYVAQFTWADEINKWDDFKDLSYSIAVGSESKRLAAFEADVDIVIINRDNVNWMMKSVSMKPFQVLVLDELTTFKNFESKRTLSIDKIRHRFEYRWGLTGTPVSNGYLDLFAQLWCINPDILGNNFFRFRNKYFYPKGKFNWAMKTDSETYIQEKIRPWCISLSAKDYLDMPALIENWIPIEMPKGSKNIYRAAAKNEFIQVKTEGDEIMSIDLMKALTIKLQQISQGFVYGEDKNPHWFDTSLFDRLQEILDTSTGNILVFYNYKAEKEILVDKFKAVELKKDSDFKNWNLGYTKLAIAHPASLGYGMNLQAGGNNIVWFGLNYSLDLVQQANARLYRQGQNSAVVVSYLYNKNTIQNKIKDVLQGKLSTHEIFFEVLKYCKSVV